MVLVLALGGSDTPSEQRGDLAYLDGVTPKGQQGGNLVASIADITFAEVTRSGAELVFTAEVATAIPRPLKISALEFRWEIAGDGPTWTLTVAIENKEEVSLFSDAGFGAGTVDDTFPGTVTIDNTKLEVRMDPATIEAFPETFEWNLTTTLRAFRNEPDSPRVEDHFPDNGSEVFES